MHRLRIIFNSLTFLHYGKVQNLKSNLNPDSSELLNFNLLLNYGNQVQNLNL